MGVRAEVRRLPGARLRRRRRASTCSRAAAKPLLRYFPELEFPEGRYVIDGELVILDADGREEFNALQARLHPAESRVRMLAEQTPAIFRAFDLLAVDRRKLTEGALQRAPRRARGADRGGAGAQEAASGSVELTPLTKSAKTAEPWLDSGEGVIAKQLDATYRPGERKGMVKVKQVRTIDCVIVGWRPGKEEGTVGSLILGLYDKQGQLRADRAHLGPEGEGEARPGEDAEALRDRRARQRRPEPLGRRPRPRVDHASGPSWWSRSPTTTPAAAASATAPRSCAGATTRSRATARSTSWSELRCLRTRSAAGRARRGPPRSRRPGASGSRASR